MKKIISLALIAVPLLMFLGTTSCESESGDTPTTDTCQWTTLSPVSFSAEVKDSIDVAVYKRTLNQNYPDSTVFIINSYEEFVNTFGINNAYGGYELFDIARYVDFSTHTFVWGSVTLPHPFYPTLVQRQDLLYCPLQAAYKFEFEVNEPPEAPWTVEGYAFFWNVYPKFNDTAISLNYKYIKRSETEETVISVTDVNATIIQGCFEYETADTISIELDTYPSEIISVYPAIPIPDSLRIDGLRVVVSGNILKNDATGNNCLADPTVKLVPSHKFIITNIEKINVQ